MARLSMPYETSRSSLVTVRGVSKRFAAAWALNQVDLTLQEGEIHALCGENGAGKSTLIQILGGVFRPDAGRIEIDGKEVRFRDPSAALEEGIGIIYQELNLVEPFTIAENLALGHEPRLGPWIDRRGLDRRARSLLEDLGFDLDPQDLVAGLTIGQRQQVEIAKALSRRVRILILDEPTAALSRAETDRLFQVLRGPSRAGLAILYTLTSILTQASIVGVLALGQAFVLIGGALTCRKGRSWRCRRRPRGTWPSAGFLRSWPRRPPWRSAPSWDRSTA